MVRFVPGPTFALALLVAAMASAMLLGGGAAFGAEDAAETEEAAPADEKAAAVPEGEEGEPAPEPLPALWPETPEVEPHLQPYVLIRALRAVQDEIAHGNASAHEMQRQRLRELSEQMRDLPVGVWDDVRNVRAAIFFVLSGGDPAVLKTVIGRPKTPFVERRLIKGALAYGEGRLVDALALIHKIEARTLDPILGGMIALIQGTLIARKEPLNAVKFFDEARLLAPGTLIEESALRQEILIIAREGELERFDLLAAQYSRRFPKSLFARNFRRQFFAGVARQNFKRASEWISRTETELMKVPVAERVGLYLAIAEEATKGGNVDIARFAAGKVRDLAQPASNAIERAKLFEGAAMVVSEDFERGAALLNEVDRSKLTATDLEIRESALAVARSVGTWPSEAAAEPGDAPPSEALARAETLLGEVDTLLGGRLQ